MNYSVIILCAGKGSRTGLSYNKMFYKINDMTIYENTLNTFLNDKHCTEIIVVCKNEEKSKFKTLIDKDIIKYVEGGKERQDSVYNGLKHVSNDYVFIHDGARCFITQDSIDKLLECLKIHDACLLMVPCTDTIKQVIDGKVVKTLNRNELYQAQTPQAFKTSLILEAYDYAYKNHILGTDDASFVELLHKDIYVVEGDYSNIKVTTPKDINNI